MTRKTSTSSALRRRTPLLAVGAAMAGLVATSLPAFGQSADPFAGAPGFDEYGFQGEGEARVDSADARSGRVAPSSRQIAAADRLGATAARWNEYGTPKVLLNHTGTLAGPREGAAADVAREFVRANAELFRLDVARVDALELVRAAPLYDSPDLGRKRAGQPVANPDVAHAVRFEQRFGGLDAGLDGQLVVGVKADGSVAYVTSSLTGDDAVVGEQRLDSAAAVLAAAKDAGVEVGALTPLAADGGRYTTFRSDALAEVQRVRPVAVPTPRDGVRRAYKVILLDSALDEHGNPTAFNSFIDAETGAVLRRENAVEHFADTAAPSMQEDPGNNSSTPLPQWQVFPANPPFAEFPAKAGDPVPPSEDDRVLWCWDNETNPEECDEQQRNEASRVPWDVNAPNAPSFTTDGNNASTAISQASFLTPDTAVNRPFSPTRNYSFPFQDSWHTSSCNPSNFGTVVDDRNDEAAATTNLFVMHNRMHDWSYFLGFTEENYNMQKNNFGNTAADREGDPELGSSQAGRTTFNGRDNANQITLEDGIAPITNQYLWQPLAGAFYAPCVDGAYDMAVVAHEYGHAISNRMIDGPDGGTGASQGQTESWSDLLFAAYFQEFAIAAGEGVNQLALGPYVTGDKVSAIRNYAMNQSPLQYGELEYDGNGLTSPHANGEIWSATNFDVFTSLNRKYDAQFPSSDDELQRSCARGEKAADACPGNRRWNQIQFDSFLLMPSDASMVDSRDAMLAADMLRFDGANNRELWDAFAKRGLGGSANSRSAEFGPFEQGGESIGTTRLDLDAIPAYDSPVRSDESQVTFVAPQGVKDMKVFVGRYEPRSVPIADTIAGTTVGPRAAFLPGTYDMIAQAPGFGTQRFAMTVGADQNRGIVPPLRRNAASKNNGAVAGGDGINFDRFIDDTEITNWASLSGAGTASEGKGEGAQVEGRQVTVDLEGDQPINVTEVQVSAVLNEGCTTGTLTGNCEEEEQDTGSQNRFSALRSFDLLTCNAKAGADCAKGESFTNVFVSADDAFPGDRPRPKVPDLLMRSFDVRDSQATHVRLVVRDNQCTGAPAYQGDVNPDNDPAFNPDCDTMANSPDRRILRPRFNEVRAAELQVYSAPATAPREVPAPVITAQGRDIGDACPMDRVPRDSRQDDNGNIHEFSIDCMVWYEIAKGSSDTEYKPGQPVSREQMATFIVNLIEKSGGELDEGEDAFTDDDESIHEDSINKLAEAGIVGGVGDGRYDPIGTVTRDQMATFLVKGYEFRTDRLLSTGGDYFGDDDGSVHEANINRAAQAGFTRGKGAGYEPRSVVNRDAMASFLANVLDLLVEEGTAEAKQ